MDLDEFAKNFPRKLYSFNVETLSEDKDSTSLLPNLLDRN
jgi:hypothetical protein